MASSTAGPGGFQTSYGAKGHGLSGAATRSYNVVRFDAVHSCLVMIQYIPEGLRASKQASLWEQLAGLSGDQDAALDVIGKHCSIRPYPSHV
jgi:hypothetical protein